MALSFAANSSRKSGPSKVLVAVLIAAGAGLLITVFAIVGGGTSQQFLFHVVKRGSLAVIVTERGNLESQDEVKVKCQVDDFEGDQIHGTPILFIVPNGSSVTEGQLLVELDSATLRERLDRQILDTDRAHSFQIQARVKYENQQTQNLTTLAEAHLKVQLAELALQQFEDEDGGTFQLDLQDKELAIQEAQAGKLIEETNLEGVKQLYKLGYRSRGELAQAELAAMKSERQLATAISRKKELVEYQYRKTRMELEGASKSAERSLLQVERDNEALLEQSKAAMDEADKGLKKEEERRERYDTQLTNCKIYSPASGMVAYSNSRSRYHEEIREGAAVRPRQTILTLPNLTRMQVRTSIHESVLDQTRRGQLVTVRIDAFPDQAYRGTVASVAVLPDQDRWMGSDTKVYETIVTIDEEVDQIKPGMTAVVEIHVARLENVLTVPVTAVVQVGRNNWCYVDSKGGLERRPIKLGLTNDKFIEIEEGLEEGERVALNPDRILESGELDAPDFPEEEFRDEEYPEGGPRPGLEDPKAAKPRMEITTREPAPARPEAAGRPGAAGKPASGASRARRSGGTPVAGPGGPGGERNRRRGRDRRTTQSGN